MSKFESLEGRRLCAVDFSIEYSLSPNTPLVYTQGTFTPLTTATITVRNTGDADAPAAIGVGLYLSRDRKLDILQEPTDEQLVDEAVLTFPAGTSQTFTAQVELDPNQDLGGYYLIAKVDTLDFYTNLEGEYREATPANNVLVTRRPVVTVVGNQTDNYIAGSGRADSIAITQSGDTLYFNKNGVITTAPVSRFDQLTISLGESDDKFIASPNITIPMAVYGGGGNDSISTGAGNDTISGNGGKDRIAGNGGDDLIAGSGSNDFLDGGAGNDTLDGGLGNDILVGGDGVDAMLGGLGTDYLYSRDGVVDLVDGGDGDDLAFYDRSDTKISIAGAIVR
jgi:Ca2+-binding RTX toxin-like protein